MSQNARSKPPLTPLQRRNRNIAFVVTAVFFGMIGAAYASIPLYRAFCQVTGYDGTVRKADAAPTAVVDKPLTIRFDVNTRELPWTFTTEQTSQQVKLGETKLALFKVTNNSDREVTGRAIFNVVPEQAGAYFQKLECFCFSDQTLKPRETIEMPVLYFVDPKYGTDFETQNKKEVTLSYTFFPAVDAPAARKTAQTTPDRAKDAAPGRS